MAVHAKWSALKQSRRYEYLLRFGLGGLTTVAAGLIADHWGPETGGLFLAFPAIFCASATLIEKHERERKSQHGIEGYRRGTDATALDASGAAAGSLGMAAFGATLWITVSQAGLISLLLASAIWAFVAVTSWYAWRHAHRSQRPNSSA